MKESTVAESAVPHTWYGWATDISFLTKILTFTLLTLLLWDYSWKYSFFYLCNVHSFINILSVLKQCIGDWRSAEDSGHSKCLQPEVIVRIGRTSNLSVVWKRLNSQRYSTRDLTSTLVKVTNEKALHNNDVFRGQRFLSYDFDSVPLTVHSFHLK